MAKKRLDVILVERGLAQSRERAQALILSGNVLVKDQPCTKAGTAFPDDIEIRLREKDHPYVSRGALKLKKAIEEFKVAVENRVGLDVGASTGGFTQILLEAGATRVFAVDVGHNQLDWSIRSDPRVISIEKTNARSLDFEIIGQKVDVIVVDVSFISLEKIFPALIPFMSPETDLITLIKPQFEVGREEVGKGGIVQSDSAREAATERLSEFAGGLGLKRLGLIKSPITGTDGNIEFLAHWKYVHSNREKSPSCAQDRAEDGTSKDDSTPR